MSDTYANLLIERHADGYAVVTLNRPDALNALNSALFKDLADFLDAVEHDDAVRCLILTGSGDKAFAAGADIKEMADQTYAQMYAGNFFALGHDRITRFQLDPGKIAGHRGGNGRSPHPSPPPAAPRGHRPVPGFAPSQGWRSSRSPCS